MNEGVTKKLLEELAGVPDVVIHGGEGFQYNFQTELVISCIKDQPDLIIAEYRITRQKLLELKHQYYLLENKWYVKFMTKIEKLWKRITL